VLQPPTCSSSPRPNGTEVICEPDPGLARGKWEAAPWVFYMLFGIAAALAIAFIAFKTGIIGRARGEKR
jgi:hypothetical protein